MFLHSTISDRSLRDFLRKGAVGFAGNAKLKIYGTLSCRSGRRMKRENRIFFENEAEAIRAGYRPCGHCMRKVYQMSKNRIETKSRNYEI